MPRSGTAPKKPPVVSPLGKEINDLLLQDPHLAAERALRAFLRPPKASPTAEQQLILNKATQSSIEVGGVTIKTHKWATGAGAGTVLLSHGYLLRAASMTRFVQPLLEAGFNVVAWDHAAHGESGGDWGDFEIFKGTILTLATANLPLAAMVGQSGGACTVLMVLAENPSIQCPRVVCLSTPTQMESALRAFLLLNGCSVELLPFMHRILQEGNILTPTRLQTLLPSHKIDAEVLIVQDRDDLVTTMADAECLASLIENSQVKATTGLRHLGCLTDGSVVQLVTKFIVDGFDSPQSKI